jgi:threonylcarbamoyladenosine tRNA methylthiotransferase MtaB
VALARNPGAVALVTGCYAELEAAALSALDERIVVVPGSGKGSLLSIAGRLEETWRDQGDLLEAVLAWRRDPSAAADGLDPFAFIPSQFSFHSRPSLKVEEGCDSRCSYCRVRLARGPARSLPAEIALERVRSLEAAGKAEVVLTGVNLRQYRDGGNRFPDLLRLLVEGTKTMAFRISSWEPEGVDEAFLDIFAHPRIRPHIHLPVQSGSDAQLRAMARAYRREQVLAACEELRRVKGDLFIAADLIAGFPGESDEDFADTLDLVRRCRFAWIHPFPFSPRPGTAAWDLGPKVAEKTALERVAALRVLAREGRRNYVERQLGRVLEAVVEAGHRPGSDLGLHATSDNYVKLFVRGVPAGVGSGARLRCRVDGPADRAAWAAGFGDEPSEPAPPAFFRPIYSETAGLSRVSYRSGEPDSDPEGFDLFATFAGI